MTQIRIVSNSKTNYTLGSSILCFVIGFSFVFFFVVKIFQLDFKRHLPDCEEFSFVIAMQYSLYIT